MSRSVLTENHRGEGGSLRTHLAIHPKQHPKIQFPGRVFCRGLCSAPAVRDSTIDTRTARQQRRNLPRFAPPVPSVPARGLMWILAHFVRTSGAQFVAKKFPLRSRIGAPGFVTPHAPSESGAYSELLIIKIAPTECMRCDR